MGRYTKYVPPFDERNKAGERICIMCGKALTGRQERWCGDNECSRLVWIRSGDQGAMRRYLEGKEKGICQECGMDCGLLKCVVDWVVRNESEKETSGSCFDGMTLKGLRDINVPIKITSASTYVTWEADHIIPLAEGGTHHEDNIQTLCIRCHKKDTAELHRRLAEKRKKRGQLKLF